MGCIQGFVWYVLICVLCISCVLLFLNFLFIFPRIAECLLARVFMRVLIIGKLAFWCFWSWKGPQFSNQQSFYFPTSSLLSTISFSKNAIFLIFFFGIFSFFPRVRKPEVHADGKVSWDGRLLKKFEDIFEEMAEAFRLWDSFGHIWFWRLVVRGGNIAFGLFSSLQAYSPFQPKMEPPRKVQKIEAKRVALLSVSDKTGVHFWWFPARDFPGSQLPPPPFRLLMPWSNTFLVASLFFFWKS